MSQDLSSQVIFQAANNHGRSSGTPPYINTNVPARYFGYYENEHKEQFIFVYDQERKQGTLLMGDYGWDKPIPVIDPLNLDVILSKSEEMWLQSCWMAATAFDKK